MKISVDELIQYTANCYFWVFIVFSVLMIFTAFSDEYKEDKFNAIKNGIYYNSGNSTMAILRWVLFLLSIKLM